MPDVEDPGEVEVELRRDRRSDLQGLVGVGGREQRGDGERVGRFVDERLEALGILECDLGALPPRPALNRPNEPDRAGRGVEGDVGVSASGSRGSGRGRSPPRPPTGFPKRAGGGGAGRAGRSRRRRLRRPPRP